MLRKYSLNIIFLLIFILGARTMSFAQADPIEHEWYNEAKTGKIKIYKAKDGRFYGRICWLKEPDRDGKPKTDYKNPNEARRNDPELGLLILKGFKKDGDNEYNDGTIYDPKNGKTYSCKITRNGDQLHVRGYIGFSLIGRTENWTRGD
jgi:uncharacterized protein (DUF2147 family)